jgi:hypothetical protein
MNLDVNGAAAPDRKSAWWVSIADDGARCHVMLSDDPRLDGGHLRTFELEAPDTIRETDNPHGDKRYTRVSVAK